MSMNSLLKLYYQLPPSMRDIAASLRGYYLRFVRYGMNSEELVAEALERDSWSLEAWKAYQENRLGLILHRAATQVPYYREIWSKRRRAGDKASWDYLENWDILEKAPLRANPRAFIADDADFSKLHKENTSGTSGTPLHLWWSRSTATSWYAVFEARSRRWNNVSVHEHWAILGGQQVVPSTTTKPPFWIWNQALNQLYLSANHISEANAPAFIGALKKYEVSHLCSYTSSVTYLAQQVLKLGISEKPALKVIITNAEPLFSWQRELIEKAFGCPVRETYGMAEIVTAASADTSNKLRLWPEVGITEVHSDDAFEKLADGTTGRFVCTGLLNPDMPLIRYLVGDRGSLSTEKISPHDPIQLPYLGAVEGRSNDMLISRDGRRVFWINPIFYGLPVVEAQVVQNSLDEFLIRYVRASNFDESVEAEITKRLEAKMGGSLRVEFQPLSQIPKGPNNKFKAVISNLTDEMKADAASSKQAVGERYDS